MPEWTGSRAVVYTALAGNLLIVMSKFAAAVFSGSCCKPCAILATNCDPLCARGRCRWAL